MTTTFQLRDLGISPGQARNEALELELRPYVQGAVEIVPDGDKAPVLAPKAPPPQRVEYVVPEGMVPAKLDITAMTVGYSFRLRFQADYIGPCARCLEPATFHVDVDAYAVHDHDTEDEELRSDHVDDRLNQLDVSAWAREEVGLRFPTSVLCRPDCLGLCPQCGENLNENPEHEHEAVMDSRWEALKDLKLEE